MKRFPPFFVPCGIVVDGLPNLKRPRTPRCCRCNQPRFRLNAAPALSESTSAVIGRAAVAVLIGVGRLLLCALGRLVMADDTSCAGPEHTVVTGKMPGGPTHDGTLYAAFGRSRGGMHRRAD